VVFLIKIFIEGGIKKFGWFFSSKFLLKEELKHLGGFSHQTFLIEGGIKIFG